MQQAAICEEKNDTAKNFEEKMLVSHSRRADIPPQAAFLLGTCPSLSALGKFSFQTLLVRLQPGHSKQVETIACFYYSVSEPEMNLNFTK